jgi:hypothetical protein
MSKTNHFLVFLLGILVFILPIPHTIGLRNSLTLIMLITLVILFIKDKIYKNYTYPQELKNIIILFIVLTSWIFLLVPLNPESTWSLREIKGQWITPMLYFTTFILFAIYTIQQNIIKTIYTALFVMMFMHILYIDIFAINYYIDNKTLISRFAGLTGGPDNANYITNILLAFIMAEVIYRFREHKKILNINNYLLALFFVLIIFSSVIEGMRNGVVAIIFLGITSLFFMLYQNKTKTKLTKYFIAIVVLISLLLPMFYNAKNDSRWNSLIETIPIALDTQNNKYWMSRNDYPRPKLSDGSYISESNYERIAWGYEGLKLIIDNLLGIGFGRNAFGHGIEKKYGQKPSSIHSHSGLIDFGISTGIIGIIIWLGIGLYLVYIAYNYFIKYNSFFALIVLFNTTGFFARFIVDSNMRDHVFLTFLLILAFSLILMLQEKNTN